MVNTLFEKVADKAPVDPEELRLFWLKAANVLSHKLTSALNGLNYDEAFAAATAEELQQGADAILMKKANIGPLSPTRQGLWRVGNAIKHLDLAIDAMYSDKDERYYEAEALLRGTYSEDIHAQLQLLETTSIPKPNRPTMTPELLVPLLMQDAEPSSDSL